uniref:Uncharacterized protein n=1 Tax=Arundo donax TaxID=35708 RepID=A0A0A9DFB4_ARUDO
MVTAFMTHYIRLVSSLSNRSRSQGHLSLTNGSRSQGHLLAVVGEKYRLFALLLEHSIEQG